MLTPTISTICLTPTCFAEEIAKNMAEGLAEGAWNLLQGAFTGEASYINAGEFAVATIMTNRIAAVMALILVVIGAIQLINDVRKGGIWAAGRTLVAIALAWPVTAFVVWGAMYVIRFTDLLTNAILKSSGGEDALKVLFDPLINSPMLLHQAQSNMVTMLIVWLVSLVLSVVMIARNFMVLALIAVAPMALMVYPAEMTRVWSKNWAGALIAAILAKPLAALILSLAASLTSQATDMTAVLTGLVGLILAAISPLFASTLFSFANLSTGDGVNNTLGQKVSAAQNMTARVSQSVMMMGQRKSAITNTQISSMNSNAAAPAKNAGTPLPSGAGTASPAGASSAPAGGAPSMGGGSAPSTSSGARATTTQASGNSHPGAPARTTSTAVPSATSSSSGGGASARSNTASRSVSTASSASPPARQAPLPSKSVESQQTTHTTISHVPMHTPKMTKEP